jgi:hypothetical protein
VFLVAAKARLALAPLLDRGALVSVDAHSAVQLRGDTLVPYLFIVSRDEVTSVLQMEIERTLNEAGITNPFLVSPAAPWALTAAP